jgi:hypothetical protein
MATMNRPLPRGLPFPARFGSINGWVIAAFVVVGVGAVLPVLQNSTATTRGFDVQRLQAEENRLTSDIRLTESEVAGLASLDRIQTRARAIGLGPGDVAYFINTSEPGPSPAKIPSEYLPGTAPKGAEPAPWWRSLLSWVSLGK